MANTGSTVSNVAGSVPASDSASLPPRPVVPARVTQVGLPAQSAAITFAGRLLDYVPINAVCQSTRCRFNITHIEAPVVGILDPQGGQHSAYEFDVYNGQLACTFMIDPVSSVAGGAGLRESDYWALVRQDVVPANTPHEISLAMTAGLATTDTTTFTRTIGAKVGGSFAGITAELSAELSESFGRSITISTAQTITSTFAFAAQPQEQVCGVYQLVRDFSVTAGGNLAQYLASLNAAFGLSSPMCKVSGSCLSFTIGGVAGYQTSTYLQVWGVNQTSARLAPAGGKALSAAEADALARASVTLAATS